MGFDPITAIGGAVVSNVVGKAMGGGGSAQARPTSGVEQVAGSEFQPFTYTGAAGSVTGKQVGDHGYEWSAELPEFVKTLGQQGASVAPSLFDQYYQTVQVDPYEAGEEYYQRGLDVLQPQFEQQNIDLQERLFGSGRLGAVVGGVNPEAYGLQKAQQETLSKLYQGSLDAGQALQTNRLNQLSQAADAAKALGLSPMQTEMDLINFAANLEAARSNAPKTYTQSFDYVNTPQQAFGGQIGNLAGKAFTSMFDTPTPAVSNYGFGPSSGQSWGSYGSNVANGGLWSGGNQFGGYYDPMNDFYA